MLRVVIAEPIAEQGLDLLSRSYEVVDAVGASRDELATRLADAHGLIVRSATKADAELIAAAPELRVIGRAGVGVDNVDMDAATRAGIIVVNAPQSNTLSNAEHTMALLLSLARSVPAANQALRDGEWAKGRFQGVELSGKTLGLIGLGRIGSLVAQRAYSFGMRLLAFDPYVSKERGRQMGVEMLDSADDLLAQADVVSIHVQKAPEWVHFINTERLRTMKPTAMIVNTARGGIIDEQALADALANEVIAGAALDVFEAEPTTQSPLFALDNVVVTPHLGGSTAEAQDKVGVAIAEQVDLALRGEFAQFAVNVDVREVPEAVRPYLPLAETLGRMFTALAGSLPSVIEVGYEGAIAEHDTRILTLSVLKGLFRDITSEPVSLVNAPLFADERGVEVRETSTKESTEYVNLLRLAGATEGRSTTLAATLMGKREMPRVVQVDGHDVDCPPAPHMVVVHNDDRPGMIGLVGTTLGAAGVNIRDMDVGVHAEGHAVMLLATDDAVPGAVVERLRAAPGILEVRTIDLSR